MKANLKALGVTQAYAQYGRRGQMPIMTHYINGAGLIVARFNHSMLRVETLERPEPMPVNRKGWVGVPL